jgi:tetratricopeptide (TPR) repeat protein
VRALVSLVLLVILSVGFGWFVLRFGPHSAYAHYRRALVWSEKKGYAKAIAEYGEAIRLDPQLADAYGGRGYAWLEQKEFDKAIADYAEVLRLDPRHAAAYACRGAVWHLKGEYNKSLVDYNEAIRFDAEMVSAYSSRAWIRAACPDPRLRDAKKAIESATKACELTNWNDAASLETLAAAYAEAGEFDLAVKWQTEVIAALTDSAEGHEQRARLMLYQEKKPYRMPNP